MVLYSSTVLARCNSTMSARLDSMMSARLDSYDVSTVRQLRCQHGYNVFGLTEVLKEVK